MSDHLKLIAIAAFPVLLQIAAFLVVLFKGRPEPPDR